MVKKNIIVIVLLIVSNISFGQKYSTRTGNIAFEASVPSFEEVAAKTNTASAVLDASKGDFAVLALIKGFRFKVALMEEHFNENYVESAKYPKATFKGNIADFNLAKVTDKPMTVTITGELTLHGKTKKIIHNATISKSGGAIVVKGAFDVKPQDFDIEIPSVVSKKIADNIEVTYDLTLSK
ncbi:YceI family protein [Flavobacterium rhizosphaerae]|uniref:YceI family protein n=1 Tax=Flavobacterium rhizosphaerae TaxID=3163298 RepID=A0ABW8YXF9_9FLAO